MCTGEIDGEKTGRGGERSEETQGSARERQTMKGTEGYETWVAKDVASRARTRETLKCAEAY